MASWGMPVLFINSRRCETSIKAKVFKLKSLKLLLESPYGLLFEWPDFQNFTEGVQAALEVKDLGAWFKSGTKNTLTHI